MANGVRYRYKGKFISTAKAAKLGNLPSTKKFLKSEYTLDNKRTTERRGYHKSVDRLVKDSLKKSRGEAREKRRERAPSRQELRKQERERRAYARETDKARAMAREAAKIADTDDISISDAMDRIADVWGDFDFYTPDDIETFGQEYIDYGDGYFDFDLVDLERDEDRKS